MLDRTVYDAPGKNKNHLFVGRHGISRFGRVFISLDRHTVAHFTGMEVLEPAVRDGARASRADIVRMQSNVGVNAKETRAIISRLRGDAGDVGHRNPLPHWQSRKSLEQQGMAGLGLSDADLEKIGVGTSVPGEFDLMDAAQEYGIHDGRRLREPSSRSSVSENPPSRTSLAYRHSGSGGALQPSWASNLFVGGDSAPEPVAVAAVSENLKITARLRELERKCQQHEQDLAMHKDARQRAEEESTRIRRQLEDKLQEMTTRVLTRDNVLKEQVAADARQETARTDAAGAAPQIVRGMEGSVQYARGSLQRLQEEVDEARAAAEDERNRANQLLYQLERLRCDSAQELAASQEAAAAARSGIAVKAEECRQLRHDLDNLRSSAEAAARAYVLEKEEVEKRAGREEARWRKVEETIEAAKDLIPSYRPADALVSLLSGKLHALQTLDETLGVETNSHFVFPATQALKSNKDTIDELVEKLKKAAEDASGE